MKIRPDVSPDAIVCVLCMYVLQAKAVERERTAKWLKMMKHWERYFPGDKVLTPAVIWTTHLRPARPKLCGV